jgi:serine/threonine-protein kinase RIO1
VAEVHIHRTALGDETLAMAEDDDLAASATFASLAERWITRDSRRLEKCWLASIAMVPEPAYAGAKVLAMRAASERHPATTQPRTPTPNLDELRLWQLEQNFDHLTQPLA